MRVMLHRRVPELPDRRRESAGARSERRILIDALGARFGGTAYAVVHLARHLARKPDVAAVIVVTRRGSIVERGLAREHTVRPVVLPARSRVELVRRVVWEAVRLRSLAAREDCDVVISMAGMLPRSPGSAVICLLFNPVMYERSSAGNALRRWAVRRTCRTARFVAAPSRLMAELAATSIGRECAVVPLGVDHDVFAPPARPGKEILCVADFYRHKRHDLILDAWLLLPVPRPRLRFIGNPAVEPATHAALVARIRLCRPRTRSYWTTRFPLVTSSAPTTQRACL